MEIAKSWGWLAVLFVVFTFVPHNFQDHEIVSMLPDNVKPNELGKVMILEYHLIEPKETRWGRSDTVTFPARVQSELNSSEFKSLRVVAY